MNKSMNIAVVGGGTAGFVSALIIKATFPKMKIDIIRSSKIGTIGVGEGSTEHWSKFMDYVGITAGKLIKECDSTFTIKYDDEIVADAPHFCPFCGEMLIETDEIQRDDD